MHFRNMQLIIYFTRLNSQNFFQLYVETVREIFFLSKKAEGTFKIFQCFTFAVLHTV